MDINTDRIRNFAIIAHIDHGKSTLSDRFLTHTGTVSERDFRDQFLDDMDLERERGITIKSHPVRMLYHSKAGEQYVFNLIDTPGHVDFAYEVSRSLAACEGALVVVDAAQGVQAQTVANVNTAMNLGLPLIPVINKIDLPAADVDQCLTQLEEVTALPAEEAFLVSAKDDVGIDELLEACVSRVPPPRSESEDGTLRALVFDSFYNTYRGVVSYVRIFDGSVQAGDRVKVFTTGREMHVQGVAAFEPDVRVIDKLGPGEVGCLLSNIKDPAEVRIGDTITSSQQPCSEPLPGFREVHPMVYSGVYPINSSDYEALKQNIARLRLNDSAFTAQPETSTALGAGFRCGFLGLLHMEITQERLSREYGMDIIVTYPSVVYRVQHHDGTVQEVENPLHWPDPSEIARTEEPVVDLQILTPSEMLGQVMNLLLERRPEEMTTATADSKHVLLKAVVPLQEVIIDFYDKLKTITRGYGSLDYKPAGYREAPLRRMDILVNGQSVDAFASVVHRDDAEARGRELAARLKDVLPRQMFQIAIQATVGGKVVARENVKALRKNVTAKCYGGDVTRKRKLLERQKEGKKNMKQVGEVNIPQDAFVSVLRADQES